MPMSMGVQFRSRNIQSEGQSVGVHGAIGGEARKQALFAVFRDQRVGGRAKVCCRGSRPRLLYGCGSCGARGCISRFFLELGKGERFFLFRQGIMADPEGSS